MHQLISINYENENPTVSGRDLHAVLEVTTDYPHWFSRMCEYGFDEGKSYRTILTDRSDGLPGKPRTDHAISIPMAKELCMLQRSEMGRKFRQYFISVEEAWNTPEKIMERALLIAHKRAEEAERKILSLTAENVELAVTLNTSLEYWTVMKYNTEFHMRWTMSECQSIGRRLSAYCRSNGYEIKPLPYRRRPLLKRKQLPATAWDGFMEVAGL